jgi:hypothetical protein
MKIIDITYFQFNPLLIPNSGNAGSGVSLGLDKKKKAELENEISRYEAKYLKSVLGLDLYAAFDAGLKETTVEAKWTDLSAHLADTVNLISPIANYAYFFYVGKPAIFTDAGAAIGKLDNQTRVSNVCLQVNAWNDAVSLNRELLTWLIDNRLTYETDTIKYPSWCKLGLAQYINSHGI